MKSRINLQFIDNRIYLTSLLYAPRLRILYKAIRFALDTGSPASFFSQAEVKRLSIHTGSLAEEGFIFFGGSKHKVRVASAVDLIMLTDQNEKKEFKHNMQAIETTKKNLQNLQVVETLPSIIGLDFLKEHKLSLHVFPSQQLAYLEVED